ncbi:hypothetical protein T492DRAFT_857315 [Pavlovales sp. CCMP2436]|nr:hypothetical protein T492DRAFT_857315 [Pavlovales sp. CCMP2436]
MDSRYEYGLFLDKFVQLAATCGLLLVRHGFPIDVAEAATFGLLLVFNHPTHPAIAPAQHHPPKPAIP